MVVVQTVFAEADKTNSTFTNQITIFVKLKIQTLIVFKR